MMSLALLLAAAPAPENLVQYYGFPGNDSCANWTENRDGRTSRNQVLEGWLLGFITGYNHYGSGTRGLKQGGNATALLGWIDQYCEANPLDSLYAAALKLIDELERRSR